MEGDVTINGNTTVTATFTQDEYTLDVTIVGQGTVTKAPDQPTYHLGDVVTLTAAAADGWSFTGWSTNVVEGDVTINGNTTVTATFTQDEYTLDVTIVGQGTVTKAPNQTTYHLGDVVTLTAAAADGWSFTGWSTNVVEGDVTINGNTTVTATFTQDEYTLDVTIVGQGTVTKAPNQTTYHLGDVVTLTAAAADGWSFTGWSANVVEGNVTINGNTTVTATFTQDEYTLDVTIVGQGTVTKAPDQTTYHLGDVVTLTAAAADGWSFTGWSTNVVEGDVTINGNTTVTATFTQDEYTLDVTIVGQGTVTKAPNQTTYHLGDVVTLTAAAADGWSFTGWSANVVEGEVTINGNTTVTATFTQDEYTLDVTIVGQGTVTKAPNQTTYHLGDVVTLTAAAADGWSFTGWSTNVVEGNVTINGNTTVTATFTQDEYTLDVTIVGQGTVTKEPNQTTYHLGDVVTLTAAAADGWSFTGWSTNVVDRRGNDQWQHHRHSYLHAGRVHPGCDHRWSRNRNQGTRPDHLPPG